MPKRARICTAAGGDLACWQGVLHRPTPRNPAIEHHRIWLSGSLLSKYGGRAPSLGDQLVDEGAILIQDVLADDGLGLTDRQPVRADVELVPARLQDHGVARPNVELSSELAGIKIRPPRSILALAVDMARFQN